MIAESSNRTETTETFYVLVLNGQVMTCTTLLTTDGEIKTSLSTLDCNPIWRSSTEAGAKAALSNPPIWADSSYEKPFIPKQYLDKAITVAKMTLITQLDQLRQVQATEDSSS